MAEVIAGLYELKEQIGAGGGGIVYLGRHIRLEKDVVLKADKRRLSTSKEALRREVDLLKNLRQTYIPQVYDFVEENGVVYTVMDYIEGESFDKILGRNQHIEQADLVKWSCQLLRALCYLHAQPPHGILHGDIKPANIMLRPDGNVCLIDYNIALALGEDGAVKVGFSRGYASPEHYGADYIRKNRAAAGKKTKVTTNASEDIDATLILEPKTPKKENREPSVLLDARSDIYSLGATLYHMISGKPPAQDAREVVPLTEEVCSKAIIRIIQKAMDPQPDQRYQSAEEMLQAFLALYKNDPRMVCHRKAIYRSVGIAAILFLLGGACTFVGLNQMKQREYALVLSEYSANAFQEGNVEDAIRYALQAIPDETNLLAAPVTAQAQKVLTDALGVYDLETRYDAYSMIQLPAAPFDLTLSPEGKRLGIVYAYEVAVYDLENNEILLTSPIQQSAYADVVFADEDTVIYAGKEGITSYDLVGQQVKWIVDTGTMITISDDRTTIAVIGKEDDYARIYDVSDGKQLAECHFEQLHIPMPVNDIFADAKDSIFALNADGSELAISLDNGSVLIFEWTKSDIPVIVCEESDFTRLEGGFCGNYFAYTAYRPGESRFRLVDRKNQIEIGGYDSQDAYHLQTKEENIYLASGNLLVEFDPETWKETELAYSEVSVIKQFAVDDGTAVISTEDQQVLFFAGNAEQIQSLDDAEEYDFSELAGNYAVLANRNRPSVRILKKEDHQDAFLVSYDPQFEHDEARMSMDGQTAMLFNYKQFAIYDRDGKLVMQDELPDADAVYDQQFIRSADESYLKVIWYDGTVRCFDAKTGELISERKEEEPTKDLYEEFMTDQYIIRSSLHEPAEVYDRESGKRMTILEQDSYLTYVTQISDGLMTEYVRSNGERYGLLLNQKLETIAYLPDLCDVTAEYLVFDDYSGNLRKSPVYTLKELTELGRKILSEKTYEGGTTE